MLTTGVLVIDVNLSLVLFTVDMYEKQMTLICLHVAQGVEVRIG